ncbi:MAG: GNAT family N-acetyltransferase, partial [Caulobacteraceae bacterium]|nr:GNAT family N-acetyltransferase [Caulobacteraceae bacterium]
MQVDVISDWSDFEALRGQWEAVYAADPDAHVFLSWSWLADWLQVYRTAWFVLAARTGEPGEGYVAFLPIRNRLLFDAASGFYNELALAGARYADYAGMLARPDAETAAAKAFADCLKDDFYWASLRLDGLLMSERRRQAFLSRFAASKFKSQPIEEVIEGVDHYVCPYLDLPASWDEYLGSLSRNERQKMRRLLGKADASEEMRIELSPLAEVPRDLETMLGFWKTKWRPSKGEATDLIAARNQDMLCRRAEHGALLLPVFRHGDRFIAALAILDDPAKRTLNFLMTGRDETYGEAPAGYLLHAWAIRHAIEHGYARYDFLKGDEHYKYLFGCKDRRLSPVTVSTRSGRNLADAFHPSWLPGMLEMAGAFERDGQPAEAERAYRQILRLHPADAQARFSFGRFLTRKGAHGEARALLAAVVEAEPGGQEA